MSSNVVHRLAMLQELTSALSRVRSEGEVGAAIATVGCATLGAITGCVWIERDGVLVLAGNHGVPPEFIAPFERIPLAGDDLLPAVVVFQRRAPLWVETVDDYVRASVPIAEQARAAGRMRAFAALPLIADDAALGVVAFAFTPPHAFTADERAYATTLAHLCSQALHSVRRYEAERRQRESIERLQALSAALAAARSAEDVHATISQVVAAAFGAAAARLYTAGADALLYRRAPAGFVGLPGEPDAGIDHTSDGLVASVYRGGTALYLRDLDEVRARNASSAAVFERAGMRSCALTPLHHGERVLGVMSIAFRDARTLSRDEQRLFETMAHHCADALARIALYEENLRARRAAEAANRAKDDFLAMLGHELRNPLAPIVSALELLTIDAAGSSRLHSVIERQVRHLQRLVDDLLDVSRISRGALEVQRETLALDELIRHALETASPLIDRKRHRVHLELAAGVFIDADRVRLVQVLANLVANAGKFTPPDGDIWISTAVRDDKVVLVIADSGPGIPPEILPRIFEPFVQGPQPLDRADGGLGVGLSLVKHLVELHDGTVVARSRARGGTELVLELPLSARRAAVAAAATAAISAGSYEDLRVLLVDDNVDAAELLAEMLRLHGCEVRIAHDASEALAIADSFVADLALLDIGLPEIDGYELAARLRSRPALSAMRIAALTGYGQDGDVARSRDAGFIAHFAKPLALERLEALLASMRTS